MTTGTFLIALLVCTSMEFLWTSMLQDFTMVFAHAEMYIIFSQHQCRHGILSDNPQTHLPYVCPCASLTIYLFYDLYLSPISTGIGISFLYRHSGSNSLLIAWPIPCPTSFAPCPNQSPYSLTPWPLAICHCPQPVARPHCPSYVQCLPLYKGGCVNKVWHGCWVEEKE